VSDTVVYVGGDFLTMGGQSRNSLAALDPVTGLATSWNPGADASVHAVALLDGTIYVGGWFDTVNGATRHNLAAIDQSGAVTSWAPNANNEVQALVASDSTVYAGGFFTAVSGEDRPYFAALDARTGAVRQAYPQPDDRVWALATGEGAVYVGGAFRSIGSWPQANFAGVLPPQPPSPPAARALALAPCAPNPVQDHAVIRFALPAAAPVDLAVFDLQGRRVATLLKHEPRLAGIHEVPVRTAGWPQGFYFCRLAAGGAKATRKMVVLN
jgi:hypothetical protein